jgi:Protein of unknown function (DUF5661)
LQKLCKQKPREAIVDEHWILFDGLRVDKERDECNKGKAMKLHEVDLVGKPTPSVDQIALKHKVSRASIQSQLNIGISVEQEHTGDRALAREIALDHLDEFPDYYDRLKKIEQK